MATEVLMPQMGESIAEGTITKWLVKEGDEVERDQPLFEISTDKVDAEIPSPAGGVLTEIKHQEGDTVSVNEVVALIGKPGEKAEKAEKPAKAEKPEKKAEAEEPPAPEKAEKKEKKERKEEEPEEGEEEEEEGEAAKPARRKEAATEKEPEEGEEKEEEPAEGEGEKGPARKIAARMAAAEGDEGAEAGEEDEALGERIRKFSSPVVRKIAAEEEVDISEVEGSGVHGRVTKRDILSFIEDRGKRVERKPAAAAAGAGVGQNRPVTGSPAASRSLARSAPG